MSQRARVERIESPPDGARHCISTMPYRSIVFARMNAATPLFWVANTGGGPWAGENALRKAFETHGGCCYYCQKKLTNGAMTIDHVECIASKGGNSLQNLVLSCKPCNAAKAHKPIEAFEPAAGREWLTSLLKQVEERLRKLD